MLLEGNALKEMCLKRTTKMFKGNKPAFPLHLEDY